MSKDWDYKSPVNGQPTPRPTLITSENAREYAERSAKVRRENGKIRNALLKELAKTKTTKDGRVIGGYEAMAESAIANAMKNPKFWELIRDTIGEKPVDKVDMSHAFVGDFDIVLDGEDGD